MIMVKKLLINLVILFILAFPGISCYSWKLSEGYHESAPFLSYEAAFKVTAKATVTILRPILTLTDKGIAFDYAPVVLDIDYSGSAFAFEYNKDQKEIFAMTAGHVCEMKDASILSFEIKEMYLTSHNKKFTNVKVETLDTEGDLCILKGEWREDHKPVLPKIAKDYVLDGTPVYMIGAPYGKWPIRTYGIIEDWIGKKTVEEYNIGPCYLFSGPIKPGNSGSAVFNQFGEIIGVAVAAYDDSIGYVIDSKHVLEFIKNWKKSKATS